MKVAVVSDLHANLQAWQAVLRDIGREGVDVIVCLGDIVGYGPQPAAVMDDILSRCDNFVLGNHDAVIGNRLDARIFNPVAREMIDWTREHLDPAAEHFFAERPSSIEFENVLFVHAEAEEPERWTYIFNPEGARPSLESHQARLILVGHTHMSGVFNYDREKADYGPLPFDDELLNFQAVLQEQLRRERG